MLAAVFFIKNECCNFCYIVANVKISKLSEKWCWIFYFFKIMLNNEPFPFSLSHNMLASISSAIRFTIERPSPVEGSPAVG